MGVEGTWDITIATPMGKQAVVLVITLQEGRMQGTARQGQETVPFLDPAIDGDRLTWNQNVIRPLRLNVKFAVTVAGDTMTGTAKAGMFPASKVHGLRAAGPPL